MEETWCRSLRSCTLNVNWSGTTWCVARQGFFLSWFVCVTDRSTWDHHWDTVAGNRNDALCTPLWFRSTVSDSFRELSGCGCQNETRMWLNTRHFSRTHTCQKIFPSHHIHLSTPILQRHEFPRVPLCISKESEGENIEDSGEER